MQVCRTLFFWRRRTISKIQALIMPKYHVVQPAETTMVQKGTSKRPIIVAILVGALLIGASLALGLAIGLKNDESEPKLVATAAPQHKSATGTYKYAAVVTDSEICSEIGNDILARHRGNAFDAAVAALVCVGVVNGHSAGIGGGSFYTIYHKANNSFWTAISREVAPGNASQDMYTGGNEEKSTVGGLSVAVPGEVKGMWEVQQRFGLLPWKTLIQPTIKLCKDGVPLSNSCHKGVGKVPADRIDQFRPYFDDDNNIKPEGSLIKLPNLARTLQTIADDPTAFYIGQLARDIVQDLAEDGGIISLQDLANYKVKWSAPTNMSIHGGYQVYSTPPPGSGLVLSYILGVLSGYKMDVKAFANLDARVLTAHRTMEAFKFGYGKRSELGDADYYDVTQNTQNMTSPSFCESTRRRITDGSTHSYDYYNPAFVVAPDEGTAHLSVLDAEGNAISITSTVNLYFGSKVRGRRTGIVFNNQMDDFSTPNMTNYFGLPPSPANFIKPGKRPMSSMSPSIVWDNTRQRVKLVTGASGGSKITTATAQNIMDVLWLGLSVSDSVDRPRLHHQLIPHEVQKEPGYFQQEILDGLRSKGHDIGKMQGTSVVQAIAVNDDDDHIVGVADFRKGGVPKGY